MTIFDENLILVIDNAKALVTKHHVGADEVFNEEFSFFIYR